MKVMLTYPSFSIFNPKKGSPLGLAALGACLEASGHTVKIIDPSVERYNFKTLINRIKDFDPDVLGVNVLTVLVYDAYRIVRYIKKINPNCLTVFGGPHPTILPEDVLKECPGLDVVVRGEGELTFNELVDNYEKNIDFKDIQGISYRNNRIIHNPNRPLIDDLDILPFPAYHLLPLEKYKLKRTTTTGIEGYGTYIFTSRGCPYNCNFCSCRTLWGKQWRTRSPEKILEEVKILKDRYNFNLIEFSDDTFTISKKRTEKICELIKKENIDINWSCSTRVEMINEELVTMLKNSDCYLIGYSIESAQQKTIDFLCKGFTVQQSIDATKTVKKSGLQAMTNIIIGVPGETKEDINNTIRFAEKLDFDFVYSNILTPLPGTKLLEYAEKNDMLITRDWSKYTTTHPVMKIPGIRPFELKGFLTKANIKFMLRKNIFF